MSGKDGSAARPGAFAFALIFLALSVGLLSQIGTEARFSPKAWGTAKMFAQPAFWPGLSLGAMAVFGALHLGGLCRARRHRAPAGEEMRAVVSWLRPLEYLLWFMVYVFAVPVFGYLPASVVFTTALALRAGYRARRELAAAAGIGFAIVLIFKTALSVRIPGGALYEHLPDSLRSLAIVNF